MTDTKSRPTSEYRFFLYDQEGEGMTYYRDKEERDKAAKEAIANYLDCNEWVEEVEYVCVGEVTATTEKTNVTVRPPADEIDEDGIDQEGDYWDGDCEEKCNYELFELTS